MNQYETIGVEAYEAPKVKVIEVEVEKGFATSDGEFEGDDIYIQ